MTRTGEMSEVFDVLVIGAGPGGTQAAVSAAHQMRHVLLLDASKGEPPAGSSVLVEDGEDRGRAGVCGDYGHRVREGLAGVD